MGARWFLARAMELDPKPFAMVVTHQVDVRAYDDAVRLGAVGYLREPVTVKQIAQVAKACLKDRSCWDAA